MPEELSGDDVDMIKQTILKQDGYLIGTQNRDPEDKALTAKVSAGSVQRGFDAANVIDGITRRVDSKSHQWRSISLHQNDAWLQLDFGEMIECSHLHLTFDTNFSRPMTLTQQDWYNERMVPGSQPETVKDYRIDADSGGGWNAIVEVSGNFQRRRVHSFNNLRCKRIRVTVSSTNGVPESRIFEVRCYS